MVESAGVNSCTGKALNKRNPSKCFSLNIMKQWKCPSNIILNHGFSSILGTGLEFEFLMQYSWEAMQANMPFYQVAPLMFIGLGVATSSEVRIV